MAKSVYKCAFDFRYSIAIELDDGGVCFVIGSGRNAITNNIKL
jgi:hypothetical protein